jgi:uncharacterized protein YdhG (YjbR/CyaY superfamily)
MKTGGYPTIDDYIEGQPENLRVVLQKIREVISDVAPQATESISYGIPTFKLHGKNLVHFAAFSDHYSFFPTSSGIEAFKKELEEYNISKGTIRLPNDKDLPLNLIKAITEFRKKEIEENHKG